MDKSELIELCKSISKEVGNDFELELESVKRNIEVIPTGVLALDVILGVGGFPRGRIVEIFGPEMSGKTTLTLCVIANAQKLGYSCAFLDMEHALDMKLARGCGVNTDELFYAQPAYGEQCLQAAVKIAETGKIDILVIDSVAALIPKKELDGTLEDNQMGEMARMMGKGIRKLTPALGETGTICIFINQIRDKIGTMYGSPEVTPGGRALKFAASVRLNVKRKDAIIIDKKIMGNVVNVKVVKNKVSIPHREAVFDLLFGKGADNFKSIIELGIQCGVIEKKSSYYSYKDIKANGTNNFAEEIRNAPELYKEISDLVMSRLDNVAIIGDDQS